jgi:hypothetical protein
LWTKWQRNHRLTVPTLLLAGTANPIVTPGLLQGGERYASDRVPVALGSTTTSS